MTTIKDAGKGINKDLLPSELELGVWSDAANFRFTNGFAEKWEGATSVLHTTVTGRGTTVAPTWFDVWNQVDRTQYSTLGDCLLYSNGSKAYGMEVTDPTIAHRELTRYTDSVFISSITHVGTTATLTTTSAHGRTTGDLVTVYDASPDQYNTIGSLGVAITVTGATSFTYTTVGTPASNASLVGAFYYAATVDFTSTAGPQWTSGQLSNFLLMNSPANGLYYWAGVSLDRRLRRLPAMGTMLAYAARVFKDYIVLLNVYQYGAGPGGINANYASRVQWSNAAEPGSLPTTFTASATNDAGFVDLADTGGTLVDCLKLGEDLILYKTDSRYAMQYIGGNDVFRFTRLPGADGLVNRNCVVDTPKGHVFLTSEFDIKIHQGGVATSIANARVRSFLTNLSAGYETYAKYSYMARNDEKKEVFFGLYSSTTATAGLLWNWQDDTWAILDFGTPEIVYATNALMSDATGATPEKTILLLATTAIPTIGGSPRGAGDIGTGDSRYWSQVGAVEGTLFTNAITGTLERIGMHFDDRDTFKSLQRSRWNIDGDAGETATVYHGSSKTADAAPTYTAGGTYTIGTTDYVGQRATMGRFCALKLSTTAYPVKVRSIDLDITGGGKR